jgi:hypothetical protein
LIDSWNHHGKTAEPWRLNRFSESNFKWKQFPVNRRNQLLIIRKRIQKQPSGDAPVVSPISSRDQDRDSTVIPHGRGEFALMRDFPRRFLIVVIHQSILSFFSASKLSSSTISSF